METDGAESSVQWIYAPDGKPVGSREEQSTSQMYYTVLPLQNFYYFDFVPGEDGVVKVAENTVYYEDDYAVCDVEDGIVREMTGFSNDGQPWGHFKMNEFGQLLEMEFYDSNGDAYQKVEYTYEEIPVES